MASLNQRLADFAHAVGEKVRSILRKTNELEQRIQEISLTAGPPGPPGSPGQDGTPGAQGTPGRDGIDGATFTPSVSQAGELTWSNNKGLQNPPAVNIKGPKGDGANISISDSVTSNSQTSVASSKAVKTAYDEAKQAKLVAEAKVSYGTTLEHYGITDAVKMSDLNGFLRNNGQQTITGGDLDISSGEYSSVNLKNRAGRSARFEGRPDSDKDSFMHFIYKGSGGENLFRAELPKENGIVALRPKTPIQIWAGNVTNGGEFNVSHSIYNRHLIIYLQTSSSHTLADNNLVCVASISVNQIPTTVKGEVDIYTGYYEGGWKNVKLKVVNEKRLRVIDVSGMYVKAIYII